MKLGRYISCESNNLTYILFLGSCITEPQLQPRISISDEADLMV